MQYTNEWREVHILCLLHKPLFFSKIGSQTLIKSVNHYPFVEKKGKTENTKSGFPRRSGKTCKMRNFKILQTLSENRPIWSNNVVWVSPRSDKYSRRTASICEFTDHFRFFEAFLHHCQKCSKPQHFLRFPAKSKLFHKI